MSPSIEFCFDFVSPYSFVANAAIKEAVKTDGVAFQYRPVFLGAIMKATDNRPPGMVAAKGAWMMKDLKRCAARHGLSWRLHPDFPLVDTRPLLRATIAMAQDADKQTAFVDLCFHHMWSAPDPLQPTVEASVRKMCESGGFDADEVLQLSERPDTKSQLIENTNHAIARGAFGAPSFFVEDELFFGQDRLDFAIEAARA